MTKAAEAKTITAEVFTTTEEGQIVLRKDVQEALDACKTTSAKIRYLATPELGLSDEKNKYGRIAKILDKRIQHVRNVLTQPLKKS